MKTQPIPHEAAPLDLETLFKVFTAVKHDTIFRVYFNPDKWLFYLIGDGQLNLTIPENAELVSNGTALSFYSVVCRVLSLSKYKTH